MLLVVQERVHGVARAVQVRVLGGEAEAEALGQRLNMNRAG